MFRLTLLPVLSYLVAATLFIIFLHFENIAEVRVSGAFAEGEVRTVPMLDGKIVGGNKTTIMRHPYQVSVQYYTNHICGGSLITPTKVLTAAHCTDEAAPNTLNVRVGSCNRQKGGLLVYVQSVCVHPQYNQTTVDFDIAVLVLTNAVHITRYVRTIALAPAGSDVPNGTLATVTGWGSATPEDGKHDGLREMTVPCVSNADCTATYDVNITSRMMCYGYQESGPNYACQSEPGAPLVYGDIQIGVASWGMGCTLRYFPIVYTRVSDVSIRTHILSC